MEKAKFNVGNTAWCILHNRIVPVVIRGRKNYNDKSLYSVVTILPYFGADDLYYTTIFETELSRTPEELIEKVKSLDFTKMLESVMKMVQELENK